MVLWQHDETGRTVDLPEGKNPGRGWYKIPIPKSDLEKFGEAAEEFKIEFCRGILRLWWLILLIAIAAALAAYLLGF